DALKVELALAQQFGQAELAAAEHARDVATAAGNEAEIRKANNQVIEQQVANLTRVAEIQKKIADDAKKTADAWAEPFKRAIDQVGSGIEGALKGIITARTAQERGQAWQGLNKSIVGTGIDLGGSLLSRDRRLCSALRTARASAISCRGSFSACSVWAPRRRRLHCRPRPMLCWRRSLRTQPQPQSRAPPVAAPAL